MVFLLLKVRRQPGAFSPLLLCAAPRAQTMASIVTWRIMALPWIMYLFLWSKDELDTILQKSIDTLQHGLWLPSLEASGKHEYLLSLPII